MTEPSLISLVTQLQAEVELVGLRGISVVSHEQLNWFRTSRDTIAQLGAEYLARQLTKFIDEIESNGKQAAHCLLALLTSIRVFDRVLTLETTRGKLQWLQSQSAD